MKISPLHPEFAAEITGMDLSMTLSTKDFDQIDQAINQFSVLVFPGQNLDDQAQLTFSRLFGPSEEDHVAYYSHGKIRYIGHVGNIDDAGHKLAKTNRGVKSQTGNNMWHSDSSFRETPSLYSTLFAYEIPAQEGDTEFASGRSAYQRLDDNTRSSVDNLVGIHDYIYSRTKVGQDAVSPGQRTYMRPVRQRLVRKNPLTNQRNLFVGSHLRAIEGWSDHDARALIDRLIAEVTRPASRYRHRWTVGDFVMWDNRCVLHRGCGYDPDRFRRRLHQTRVRGAGPTLEESI